MILLNKEKHEYYDSETNEKFLAVSHFLNKFKKPFDPTGKILYYSAKKNGITEFEQQQIWDNKRDTRGVFGTYIHNCCEYYINTIKNKTPQDSDEFKNDDVIRLFNKIDFKGKLYSEYILHKYNPSIAGTADIIEDLGKKYNIWDMKTNVEFTFDSEYNNYFLPPLAHLEDCKYNYYALQLSTYAYLLESLGQKISRLTILLFIFGDNTTDLKDIREINVPYMKYEIEKLIETYKNE